MRIARLLGPIAVLSFTGVAFAAVPTVAAPSVPTTPIRVAPKAVVSPLSLATGAYTLFLNPKKIGGQMIVAKRAGALPVYVKSDGRSIVIGGKYAPQMTGSIASGRISMIHQPGVIFSMTGATFNGYAASGTFVGGATGSFAGTWALVPVTKAGFGFMNKGMPGARSWNGASSAITGSLTSFEPPGVSGSWGYDGPGLDLDTNEGSQNAFAAPGVLEGWDSKDPSSITNSLNITGSGNGGSSGSSGSTGSSGGAQTQKQQAQNFTNNTNGGAQTNAALPVNSGSLGDELYCFFFSCSDPPPPAAPMGGAAPSKPTGFSAGDWDPPSGDTTPGQKINVTNGQDTGNNGTTNAPTSRANMPVGKGDPGDFFQAPAGDILNTNKLFNGASDPVIAH